MSRKRLLKRLVTVLLGVLGFFLFLDAVDADAQNQLSVSHQLSAVSHNTVVTAATGRQSPYSSHRE